MVTPYLCGYGGDLFAMIWRDGELAAYNGSGRAPAAATADGVRAASAVEQMPTWGPHAVTVPGAPEAWFALLERFGTRSFGDVARWGLRLAAEGFPLTERAARSLERSRGLFAGTPHGAEWMAVYGEARAGQRLIQPGLARTIALLADEGPDAYYRGPIGRAVAGHLASLGGLMVAEDLAGHHGDWVEPLATEYRGLRILEMPPNTQGATVLEALDILSTLGDRLRPDGPGRHHLLIEATKLALADRDAHVTDPEHMAMAASTLVGRGWATARARELDPGRARHPSPGRAAAGGTIYLCAADSSGMCVSLIQSNYMGFGSGVTVPEWGINLHNRGAFFSLDPGQANVIAPAKRPLHTLIPAMAMAEGRPRLVFGAMGGDGQAQTHVQLLARIVDDGWDVQRAIDAPRWIVSPADWSVVAESRFSREVLEGLAARGHQITTTEAYDPVMGHAHAILVESNGYAGGTDPRAEGAVVGC